MAAHIYAATSVYGLFRIHSLIQYSSQIYLIIVNLLKKKSQIKILFYFEREIYVFNTHNDL